MVPVPPHTLALEELREPEASGDLRFRDHLLAVFRLADDEFANLYPNQLVTSLSHKTH
jgi:hypothetical protein